MKAGKLAIKRRRLGVTQEEVASRVGVDYRSLTPIENEIFGIDTETYRLLDRSIDEAHREKQEE